MRTITCSWYRVHTEPIVKALHVLKMHDLNRLMTFKFKYKKKKNTYCKITLITLLWKNHTIANYTQKEIPNINYKFSNMNMQEILEDVN